MNRNRYAGLFLAACLCLCFLALYGCANSPTETIVHVPTPVLPPAQYMTDCTSQPSDGSIGGELTRLSDLVVCERNNKAAMRTWADQFKK